MIISDSFTNSLFANICFIISEFPTNIYLRGALFLKRGRFSFAYTDLFCLLIHLHPKLISALFHKSKIFLYIRAMRTGRPHRF